jgi:hypothetical protein
MFAITTVRFREADHDFLTCFGFRLTLLVISLSTANFRTVAFEVH